MSINSILAAIDAEIAKLKQARALLVAPAKKEWKPNRVFKQRRPLSAAGRRAIAAAQKARRAKLKAAKKK